MGYAAKAGCEAKAGGEALMIYRLSMGGTVLFTIVTLALIYFDGPRSLQDAAIACAFICSAPLLFKAFKDVWDLVRG